MSLSLDQRQRAMLREMGVRVWLPAGPVVALDSGASNEGNTRAKVHFHEDKPVARSALNRPAPQVSSVPAPVPTPPTAAPQPAAPAGAEQASWRLGEARALYPQAAPAPGARWLVLAETSVAALDADPLQGDAGRLLGNMLRAARMNDSGTVLLAPLVRLAACRALVVESENWPQRGQFLPDLQAHSPAMGQKDGEKWTAAVNLQPTIPKSDRLLAAADPTADFSAALAVLVAQHQPDLVLVMGRLAAQAVLRSTVPFGKLRGQVHSLNGATTLVTYDAPYLLRRPADKARAWEDLCLAISLARAA